MAYGENDAAFNSTKASKGGKNMALGADGKHRSIEEVYQKKSQVIPPSMPQWLATPPSFQLPCTSTTTVSCS